MKVEIIVVLFIISLSHVVSAAPPAGGYVKVWEDNFNAATLNADNWTVGLKDPTTGDLVPGADGQYLLNSSYAGYITEEDVVMDSGSLVLKNQKRNHTGTDPSGSYQYTSGWVMSMHKVYFNKGYVEFRAKFPSGDKVWPALWLIAEDLVWGPEWDMWEYFGYRSDVGYDNMGTHLAYDSWPNVKWKSHWIQTYDSTYDCEAWHVYGFEWTATYAKWYIDGNLVHTLNNTIGASWPDEDMYLVLNNGVKTSSPDTTTTWPNQVEIDYVSLYQIVTAPNVSLSIDNSSINEAGGTANITATLSVAHTSPVTVNLAFSGPATESTDFTLPSTSIVIPTGSTTGTAVITASQDNINELNEMVVVDITTVINGTEQGTQQVTTSIIDDDGDDIIDTWIVAGQSNAEGYGLTAIPIVSGLTPTNTLADIGRSDLNTPEWHVQFYQGANDYNSVTTSAGQAMAPKNSWHVMTPYEGLAYDWSWDAGSQTIGNVSRRRFGPELSFGSDVRKDLNRQIAIIKYARGSIPISSSGSTQQNGIWKDYDPSDGGRLNHYDKLISAVQGAVDTLPEGLSIKVRGIVWMQGESDATSTRASGYQTNLTEFITTLRTDLETMATGSSGKMTCASFTWAQLDVFVGTILNNDTENGNHTQTVIDAQNAVAAADNHVFAIDGTNGISTMSNDDWGGDGIHYDTAGQVLLGERFAAKALEIEAASYSTWTTSPFSLPMTNFGPTENPDGDLFTNLQEFAFGMDPTILNNNPLAYVAGGNITQTGVPLIQNFAAQGQTPEFRAVFLRRKDHAAAGIDYHVGFSAELQQWTTSGMTPTLLTDPGTAGAYEAVSVPYPITVPAYAGTENLTPQFFRVEISPN